MNCLALLGLQTFQCMVREHTDPWVIAGGVFVKDLKEKSAVIHL